MATAFWASSGGWSKFLAIAFISWLGLMWLVGAWHVANVFFSWLASRAALTGTHVEAGNSNPSPVAILYTTCNDFDPLAFESCLKQGYTNYEVLVCDDGDEPDSVRTSVENVLASFPNHPPVAIVRRQGRVGFKAGNMNNALRLHGDRFDNFAVADADEILPVDFLVKCVSVMARSPDIGFVQCSHAARLSGASEFALRHSVGIAGHWRHFMPARERYGFLSFYGHGALIRTDAWRQVGGFPEIVSEDLALAFAFREAGYRGTYLPEVVCEEGVPPDFQAMAKRAGKWVRGTSEFLRIYGRRLLVSRHMCFVEKLDVVFCALGLLLPLPFVLVLLAIAGIYLSSECTELRAALGSIWTDPVVFTAALVAMFAPALYSLAELPRSGWKVLKELVFASGTYLALVPHAASEQIAYAVTGRADFPVTGGTVKRPKQRRLGICGFAWFLVTLVLLFAALVTTDFLLMGVAVAFLCGVWCQFARPIPAWGWCASFILIGIGVALVPMSLLAAPVVMGMTFAVHE